MKYHDLCSIHGICNEDFCCKPLKKRTLAKAGKLIEISRVRVVFSCHGAFFQTEQVGDVDTVLVLRGGNAWVGDLGSVIVIRCFFPQALKS